MSDKHWLSRPITLQLIPREDGGLRARSDDVMGLTLSNNDEDALFRDLPKVLRLLVEHNGLAPRPTQGEGG